MPMKKTPDDELRERELEFRNKRNLAKRKLEYYRRYGIENDKTKILELQSEIFNLSEELRDAGMEREDLKGFKEYAVGAGKGVLTGVFDLVLRPTYAFGAGLDNYLNLIAPHGTPEGQALEDLYNSFRDGQKLGAAAGVPNVNQTGLIHAGRNLTEMLKSSEKRAALKTVLKNAATAKALGMDDLVIRKGVAQEIFSGVPGVEGRKLFLESIAKSRNLYSGPRLSDVVRGQLGGAEPSLPLPFLNQDMEVDTAEGKRTIPGGGLAGEILGNRIGFTDDGRGILALRKGGLLDPTADEVDFFATEVLVDPLTWTTAGSSGIAKAGGKALTKKGARELAKLEAKELTARKAARQALRGDTENLAKLELAHSQISAREIAERQLLEAARKDLTLLRPRREIRFMGQPIGSLGRRPGEETLLASLVNRNKIENLYTGFRNKLVKGSAEPQQAAMRDMLETVGEKARRLDEIFHQPFAAEASKIPDWLTARAHAEGGAHMKMRDLDGMLDAAMLKETEHRPLIDIISDPEIPQNFPGLTQAQRKVIEQNEVVNETYHFLSQEAVKPIKQQAVKDAISLLRVDHKYGLARRLEKRLKAAEEKYLDAIMDLEPGQKPPVPTMLRTEVFVRNPQKHIKKYTSQIVSQFWTTPVKKIVKGIKKLGKSGLNLKEAEAQMDAFVRPLWEAYKKSIDKTLPKKERKEAAKLFKSRVKALEQTQAKRAELLLATGDRGGIISALNRDDLIELIEDIRRQNKRMPKLHFVEDPIEHVRRRGQVAYAKEAQHFLIERAYQLAKDDEFAKRMIEQNLVSVGTLERHVNVNRTRVNEAIDEYLRAITKKVTPDGIKKPTGQPMTKAMAKLKTKEEKQLFLRKWMFGEGQFDKRWKPGTLSHRFWEVMNYANDVPDWAEGGARLGSKTEEQALRNWADEAMTVRKILKDEGLDIHDMLPRDSLAGFFAPDGTKFVPYRGISKERGRWRITSEDVGEPLYFPESMVRGLSRMANRGVRDPEAAGILRAWDGFTNLLKLNLTSAGGFPSFQFRNLYSNTAFGLTAAGLHYLRPKNVKLAGKMAWQNVDPKLAVTKGGYKGALRMRTMQRVAATLPEGERSSVRDVMVAIRDLYSGAREKGMREIAEDPKKLFKETKRVKDILDEVVLTTDLGQDITMAELLREIPRQRVDVDPRLLAEFTEYNVGFMGDPGRVRQATKALRDKILRSNAFFEQWSRQQLFFTFLERGVGFEEAGRLANKWMLDYARLSPLEKTYMKRTFPFYTFYRKTVPLMVESIFTRPGSVALQAKITREPQDPVTVFGTDPGERIIIQRDGNTHVIGNVDLPINSLNFLSAIGAWLPHVDAKGANDAWKELFQMTHPVIQLALSQIYDFMPFQDRKVPKQKIDALGLTFETALGKDHPIFTSGGVTKWKDDQDRIHYEIDRGLITLILNGTGLSRMSSNADRIVEGVRDVGDGELTATYQWLTGLRPEIVNMRESERRNLRKVKDAMEEELIRRGKFRRGDYIFRIDDVE